MGKILFIIPPERFRDEELLIPKAKLESKGHLIHVASTKEGVCFGSRGGEAYSEMVIEDANIDDYDGVIFVGGGGSKLLFHNKAALNIAQDAYKNNKIVAAICLAPTILANAGILNGKNSTVCGTESKTIVNKGAIYMGPGVVVDGKIVTANGPKSSQLFAEKICELLA